MNTLQRMVAIATLSAPIITGQITPANAKDRNFFNRTEPSAANDPRRNLPKEDNKAKWFYQRWYECCNRTVCLGDHIEFAKKRCNLDKKEYHSLFVVDESEKNPSYAGKIARVHIPSNPKGKPLIILITGNGEDISERDTGLSYIFHKIKQDNNATVLWLRTGFVMDEVDNIISWNGNYAYEHEVVYQHTKNIIEDYIKECEPSEIRMAGFSWGGGTIQKFSHDEDLLCSKPVTVTVMIDGIELGGRYLGRPVRERPEFKNSPNHAHMHYYQKPQSFDRGGLGAPVSDLATIYGSPPLKYIQGTTCYGLIKTWSSVIDKRPGDIVERIYGTNHNKIDIDVKDKVYKNLTTGLTTK